jgi:hypothetical protein
MSFFVFLESDALDKKFATNAKNIRNTADDPNSALTFQVVRRPHRGIQIKGDTYSTLSIVDGKGHPIPLVSESALAERNNSSGGARGVVNDYADFIIQKIEDQRVEKQTIIETFGDSFIFFFGERPRVFTFSGVLVNSEDFNWRSQFWYNYDHHLRGTKLVERNARVFLAYDSIVVEGYPINATATEDSSEPHLVPFSMTMFVTNYSDFSSIGRTDFPLPPEILGLDAANAKLHDSRDTFISTTASVREANRQAGVASGLFATIREVGRGLNSVLNLVSGALSGVETVLSGRVVRVPIGLAGFLEQTGATPIGIQETANAEAFLVAGSGTPGNLALPGPAKFAPTDPSILRTKIWANLDEYPTRDQPEIAYLPISAQLDRLNRVAEQQAFLTSRAVELTAINLAAQGQADVFGAIADVVNFTKRGFALFNNVKAAVTDIKAGSSAVILDAIGLAGVGTGLKSSAQTKAAATAKAVVPSAGFANTTLLKRDLSASTTVARTGLVNSSQGKQVVGRIISPPVMPTIPNPSITGKPNVR